MKRKLPLGFAALRCSPETWSSRSYAGPLAALCLAGLLSMPMQTKAQTSTGYRWDGSGSDPVNGQSGTWSNSTARWTQSPYGAAGATYVTSVTAGPSADYLFGGSSGTVTFSSSVFQGNSFTVETPGYVFTTGINGLGQRGLHASVGFFGPGFAAASILPLPSSGNAATWTVSTATGNACEFPADLVNQGNYILNLSVGRNLASAMGEIILTGDNTYRGNTTLDAGSYSGLKLTIDSDSRLGTPPGNPISDSIVFNTWTSSTGATLRFTQSLELHANRGIQIGRTGANSAGVGQLEVDAGVIVTYNGTLSRRSGNTGINNISLTKTGEGELVLGGTNTYDGKTVVNDGLLQFSSVNSLYNGNISKWTASSISVASGAVLAFGVGGANGFDTNDLALLLTNLAQSNSATEGIRAGSSLGFDTSGATNGSFTLDVRVANTSGSAGGALGLVKLGTGTLVLAGNNTYTGPTTVVEGTLRVTGSLGATEVTVYEGAALEGSGSVGGGITLQSGAASFAQAGSGVSSYGGNLTYSSGASLEWELAANADANRGVDFGGVDVAGTVSFASNSTITLDFDGAGSTVDFSNAFWQASHSWVLVQADSISGLPTLTTPGTDVYGVEASTRGNFSLVVSGGNLVLQWEPLATGLMTPAQYVRSRIPPNIKPGHGLPRLSSFWPAAESSDLNAALAERWGYCLYLQGYLTEKRIITEMGKPQSNIYKKVNLHLSDPAKYPLAIALSKEYIPGGPTSDNIPVTDLLAAYPGLVVRDGNGQPIFANGQMQLSPEAPLAAYQQMAQARVNGINALKSFGVQHIAVIMNSGEYGPFPMPSEEDAMRDPAVRAARGSLAWDVYLKDRISRLENVIYDAVKASVSHDVYVFYFCGGYRDRGGRNINDPGRYATAFPEGLVSNRISDLPASEIYYWYGWGFGGFQFGTGSSLAVTWDMLSTSLNGVAQNIEIGEPLSYNWLSSGNEAWRIAPRYGYMGFLKCLYTSGMLGAVEQLYSELDGFDPQKPDASFLASEAPIWLERKLDHGHVYALFTHLETFLDNGDLLPGDGRNALSVDLPSYEFSTGDANVRVLARKLNSANEWILTAWLASDSEGPVQGRYVNVTLPGVGQLRPYARTCGSVYHIRSEGGQVVWKLLDENPDLPSRFSATEFLPVDQQTVTPVWNGLSPLLSVSKLSNAQVDESTGTGIANMALGPAYSCHAPSLPYFLLVLDRPSSVPLQVNYSITYETATSADFVTPSTGVARVPAGVTKWQIGYVQPLNDTLVEGRQQYGLRLAAGTNYGLGTTFSTGAARLYDDEKPMVNIKANLGSVTEASGKVVLLRVEMAPIAATDRTIALNIGGTATGGVDYQIIGLTTSPTPTVTLPAGEREAMITIVPIWDGVTEPSESVSVSIAPGNPAIDYIAPTSATVTLTD